MAVEVLSRSTEVRDRGRKMQMFARFGVPEYWIVDPVANTLEVHRLDEGRYVCLAVVRAGRVDRLAATFMVSHTHGLPLLTS